MPFTFLMICVNYVINVAMRFKTVIGLLLLTLVLFCPIIATSQNTPIATDSLKVITALEDRASAFDTRLDSATIRLNLTIDSLKNMNLPADKFADRLDSAYRSFQVKVLSLLPGKETIDEGQRRKLAHVDSLINAKTASLDSLRGHVRMKDMGTLDNWTKKFNPNLPEISTIPQISPVTASIPRLDSNLGKLKGEVVETIPAVPQAFNIDANEKIPEVEGTTAISSISEEVKGVSEYGDGAEELTNGAEKIKEGDVVEKAIESRVGNVTEVKAIKEVDKEVDAMGEQLEETKKTASDKEALRERAKKEFVDHLAGKEDIVKKDMEDIGKVQLKYRNVPDSRFLPKRIPNEMKGKPIVERLIPGFSLQIFNGNDFSVDFAPFVGYRFSGRLSAGLSGYRRIAYIGKDDAVKTLDSYGIRFYNNFQIIKGISTHVEVERYKPENTGSIIQPMDKEQWDTKINLGLFQRYNIGKRVYGHFLIMYDLMQFKQFPNSTGSSIRFGFDYQIKKRKKSNAQTI